MFDDFSFQNQFVHSIIHLFFLIAVIRLLYDKADFSMLAKRIGWITIGVILILNFIPNSQGLAFHDNGFVPMWAQIPQTQFGWPNIFVRILDADMQNLAGENINNPLIHFSILFLNLYVISILISIELKLVSFCQKILKKIQNGREKF